MNKKIIIVTGTFFSGASAIVDYLSDHPDVRKIGNEFDDFKRYGLIYDTLVNKNYGLRPVIYSILNNLEGNYYINSLRVKGPFKLLLNILKLPVSAVSRFHIKRCYLLYRLISRLQYEFNEEKRLALATEYIQDIINLYPCKFILMDQPIFPYQNPNLIKKVFCDPKFIYVTRNNQKQFDDLKQRKLFDLNYETPARSLHEVFGDAEGEKEKLEMRAVKKREKHCEILKNKLFGLHVKFENFILSHDVEKEKILSYVGLSAHESNNLNLEESKRNV